MICRHCKSEFPYKPNAKYCSSQCRSRAGHEKAKARHKAKIQEDIERSLSPRRPDIEYYDSLRQRIIIEPLGEGVWLWLDPDTNDWWRPNHIMTCLSSWRIAVKDLDLIIRGSPDGTDYGLAYWQDETRLFVEWLHKGTLKYDPEFEYE